MPADQPMVLVVEDDVLIAMELARAVEELGCQVIGPVSTLADGASAARSGRLDCGVLDIKLGGDTVWAVADVLRDRKVPIVLVTGYDVSRVPPLYRDCPLLTKPTTGAALRDALRQVGALPASRPEKSGIGGVL